MDKILVRGGNALKGSVNIRGAKNAALPLMAAVLQAEGPCTLHNMPCLHDIFSMDKVLTSMGVGIDFTGQSMTLDPTQINSRYAAYELVRKLRASFFVLGPLWGRFAEAKVSLPGGCAIGTRPVDIHLKGLEALGANICIEDGYVIVKGQPTGAKISMDFPSVGATENLMMAAVRAKGSTRLSNVAREPEIVDLAKFLTAMGAKIEGAGSDVIEIEGVDTLKGVTHHVVADRIEAGTFLIAGMATGGTVKANHVSPDLLPNFLEKLEEMGGVVERDTNRITASAPNGIQAADVMTQPFPGYPTDLQAQIMTLMCVAEGTSAIKENVFENRFMQVAELCRMGADIEVDGNRAIIHGVDTLSGAEVMASDLRASAALVIAGLMTEGKETLISRVYHIDRGYERIEERLASLGADIERIRT